jgi:mono/diheme cytochrome c family protein
VESFTGVLNDVQIAQVLTYIRASWGNDARPVTADDVASLRFAASCTSKRFRWNGHL